MSIFRRRDPTRSEVERMLEGLPLFAELSPRSRTAIAAAMSWLALPIGTVLFAQDDPPDALYIVLFGRLGVHREDPVTAESRHTSVGSGEVIGELGLLTDAARVATATALRDSELLRLSREDFERLTTVEPAAMLTLARHALRRAAEGFRPESPPKVIAVMAAMQGIDVEGFARQLAAALGGEVRLLRAADAESATRSEEHGFADAETQVERLLLIGSDDAQWCERCARGADSVIELVDPARPIADLVARAVSPGTRHGRRIAALLQNGAPQPGLTRRTLDALSDVDDHAHIRGPEDLARLARRLDGKGTGLVLSGGGARGFAHLGAIRALREAGHTIDAIGGTSIGGVLGAGIAADWDDAELIANYRRHFVDGKPVSDLTLPVVSLYSGRSVTLALRNAFGELEIEDLVLPFFCISTDLTGGSVVAHDRGSLWLALRASSAVPGLLPPVFKDGRVLVDGAVIENLPVREMRERIRGDIIAVDARGDLALATDLDSVELPSWWRLAADFVGVARYPRLTQILLRAGMVNSDAATRRWRREAKLVIRPDCSAIDLLDWKSFDAAITAGYDATRRALDEATAQPATEPALELSADELHT